MVGIVTCGHGVRVPRIPGGSMGACLEKSASRWGGPPRGLSVAGIPFLPGKRGSTTPRCAVGHEIRGRVHHFSAVGCFGQPRLSDGPEVAGKGRHLRVARPHRCPAVAGRVVRWIGVAGAIEVSQQRRHEAREVLAALVQRHLRHSVGVELGSGGAEHVGAFHRAADRPLCHHRQNPGAHQASDLAVQARGGCRGDRSAPRRWSRRRRAGKLGRSSTGADGAGRRRWPPPCAASEALARSGG